MAAANLLIRQFPTGGDRNFGYLVADAISKKGALVDPSPSPEPLIRAAGNDEVEVLYIFATHGHIDHTSGLGQAAGKTGATVLAFGDRDPASGRTVEHGSVFPVGRLEITVLHTPGHTDDSISLLTGDALFSGDTLFIGKVGGSDMGGNAEEQYDSLHRVFLTLPDSTRVFPGHDYGTAPESTIGHERRTNPFLLQPDLKAFLDLKRNWAAYKKKHGIP